MSEEQKHKPGVNEATAVQNAQRRHSDSRINIIGQNGNDGAVYAAKPVLVEECTHQQVALLYTVKNGVSVTSGLRCETCGTEWTTEKAPMKKYCSSAAAYIKRQTARRMIESVARSLEHLSGKQLPEKLAKAQAKQLRAVLALLGEVPL